jgi:hypothetical protein
MWFKKKQQKIESYEAPIVFPAGNLSLDKHSRTWQFIEKHLKEELQKAREENDSHNKDLQQTAALRGKIRFIKELLDLPNAKDKPEKKAGTTEYDY